MAGQMILYKRVSTEYGQKTDRQAFDSGIEFDRVFEDKQSGKDRDRPQLKECLAYARSQDCLVCHSIDRLARNLKDLLDIISELNAKGVTVRFLKENLTFTGEKNPFQDLQLQILGAVAMFEREMINSRVREGIAAKKSKQPNFWKEHCGRHKSLTEEQVATLKERVANGEKKAVIARDYGISRTCLYEYLKR